MDGIGGSYDYTSRHCWLSKTQRSEGPAHRMPSTSDNPIAARFRDIWPQATADSNLTLHSFRRFKTTHLVNLRLLERELAGLDHTVYQAGLSLDIAPSSADRLGLRHSRRDADVPAVTDTITDAFASRLRYLLKDYGAYVEDERETR